MTFAFTESQATFDNYSASLKTIANKLRQPTALRDFYLDHGLPYTSHDDAVARVLQTVRQEYGTAFADSLADTVSRNGQLEIHLSNIDLPARMISKIKGLSSNGAGYEGKYTENYSMKTARHSRLPQRTNPNFKPEKVVTLEREKGGPPLLYPLRHMSEQPDSLPSTLELISDSANSVVTIHGVYFVRIPSELDSEYRRCAINLRKADDFNIDLGGISRAVYTTDSGITESGVYIERGPLQNGTIICHLGNHLALLNNRLRNLSRQYVSMISQAARNPRAITTTIGEGGRSAINASAGLLGALSVNHGMIITKEKVRRFLSDKDLGVLGCHSYLLNHKRALTYEFSDTMAEGDDVGRPNKQSIAMATEVFHNTVEQYKENQELQAEHAAYSNHAEINTRLLATAAMVSDHMMSTDKAEMHARGFIESIFRE
jgi:hypothetical protein